MRTRSLVLYVVAALVAAYGIYLAASGGGPLRALLMGVLVGALIVAARRSGSEDDAT